MQVGEIVVTAQKRAERLEDVPLAVASVSGDQLERANVTGIRALNTLIPNVRMDYSGGATLPFVRGVGSLTSGGGADSNVAMYLDGYIQPNPVSNNFDLVGITNIQVLKGPQGTLFGRNATGGAILITTRDPAFSPYGSVSASFGRFNDMRGSLEVGGPLTSDLAANLTVYGRDDDGYTRNVVSGRRDLRVKTLNVRAKVLYKPSDDASFLLTLSDVYNNNPATFNHNAYLGLSAGLAFGGIVTADRGVRSTDADVRITNRVLAQSASLTSTYDFGDLKLTSYTGYYHDKYDANSDNDDSSIKLNATRFTTKQETLTQEFNLVGQGERLDWVVGAFGYVDLARNNPFLSSNRTATLDTIHSKLATDAYAAFADGTYAVTPRLFLTGGLRYSWERKIYSFIVPFSRQTGLDRQTWTSFTPRVAVRYALDEHSNLYASYNKGFKSGTYNVRATRLVPVEPEKIDAFEAGYKTVASNWRLDLSAFRYDYKDLQFTSYSFTSATSTNVLTNAAASRIYGAEATLELTPFENFRLNVNGAYLHARYRDFPTSIQYAPSYLPNGVFSGYVGSANNAGGNRMIRSPKFSGNVAGEYIQKTEIGDISYSGNVYMTSRVYFDSANQYSQPAYATVDARIAWTSPDSKWTAAVFGSNLFDKKYFGNLTPSALMVFATWGYPRTYGVSLKRQLF